MPRGKDERGGYAMTGRHLVSVALALAIGIGLLGSTSEAQTRIRYAHVGSEGDIQHWFAEELAKRINAETQGRVVVQVFPNSQLGGVQETIDGVRSGAIPMAHHEFASSPASCRRSRSSPRLSTTATAATRWRRPTRKGRR
jgi:TRAP-type C4-dicarboxylate transport system substrate-binding protein